LNSTVEQRVTVSTRPAVILRPEKQGTFLARHPWVLDKSLAHRAPPVAAGEIVDLTLPDGRWIARGLYNPHSRIRVRLYSWDADTALDPSFWHLRLEQAIELRRQLGLLGPDTAARLVFSEGDGMSGLIVDQYGQYLVVQFTALAMQQRSDTILAWLAQHLRPAAIQVRVDPRVAKAEGMSAQQSWVAGNPPDSRIAIREYGVQLNLDLNDSQKTGYYLDQRENRVQAARFARDRSVLDVCCYVGGFALAAARAGAKQVLAIDTSQRAIDQAREHAQLNQLPQMECAVGDCFELLEQYKQQRRTFAQVILDPPRFAGSRHTLPQALQAYHRLNRLAIELLEPGGILVTCSCSGLVTREEFRQMLTGASRRARRDLQLLEQRGAAADHPVRLACPETEYLKCFICRVL
jgi:23S rRNA (cytosine1962-C5)-methyltransferase